MLIRRDELPLTRLMISDVDHSSNGVQDEVHVIRHDHRDVQPVRELMIMYAAAERDRSRLGRQRYSLDRGARDEVGLSPLFQMRQVAAASESIFSNGHPVSFPRRAMAFGESYEQ